MRAFTLDRLIAQQCDEPGCEHDGHVQAILQPRCHPRSPVFAVVQLDHRRLDLRCATCGRTTTQLTDTRYAHDEDKDLARTAWEDSLLKLLEIGEGPDAPAPALLLPGGAAAVASKAPAAQASVDRMFRALAECGWAALEILREGSTFQSSSWVEARANLHHRALEYAARWHEVLAQHDPE